MRNIILFLAGTLFLAGCCSGDKSDTPPKKPQHEIVASWNLARYAPNGFLPNDYFTTEIAWDFKSNHTLKVSVESGTQVQNQDLPLKQGGTYSYSINDSVLSIQDEGDFYYQIKDDRLLLSDSPYFGADDGMMMTLVKDDGQPPVAIDFTNISKGEIFNGNYNPTQHGEVFYKLNLWNDFKENVWGLETFPPETEVNFNEHIVVALFDEPRTNGGHSIDVVSVTEYPESILVRYTKFNNGDLTQVLTRPYHFVKIPFTSKKVLFKQVYLTGTNFTK